ncbi:MAG: hypothetical protein U5L03_04195 [Burkholderiaceae bacterium]|nr:hypothetical protein [Burkholderiaceae bacterium]
MKTPTSAASRPAPFVHRLRRNVLDRRRLDRRRVERGAWPSSSAHRGVEAVAGADAAAASAMAWPLAALVGACWR